MLKAWGTAAAAMVWVALGGCSGDDAGGSTELPTHRGDRRVAAEVDIAGGLLALRSGAEVEIPRGALRGPVTVELEEVERDALPPRRSAHSLDGPLAFRPHGQTFDREVIIEMPIDEVPAGRSARLLRLDDEDDREWEEVKGFRLRDADEVEELDGDSRQRVSFRSRHFSVYWVVAEVSGDAEGDGGAPDPDAGFNDRDASADAGMVDAGVAADASWDAGAAPDAAHVEGGTGGAEDDAGRVDAALEGDAGVDAGASPDAGAALDAGAAPDAGVSDSGAEAPDAGTGQAGIDAGIQ